LNELATSYDDIYYQRNSTTLIQGFIVERENLQKNFQKQLEQANAKYEQEIQELRKLHEDQTCIWKEEAENNYVIIVTALQHEIESLKYQVNENQHARRSLYIFKDQALQICLILRKNQPNFDKKNG